MTAHTIILIAIGTGIFIGTPIAAIVAPHKIASIAGAGLVANVIFFLGVDAFALIDNQIRDGRSIYIQAAHDAPCQCNFTVDDKEKHKGHWTCDRPECEKNLH